MATSATVVRLHAGHVRGETSPGSRYVMKEWTQLVLKLLEMQGKCAVEKFEPLFVGHAVILEEVLWKQVALYTSTFFWNYTFNKMLVQKLPVKEFDVLDVCKKTKQNKNCLTAAVHVAGAGHLGGVLRPTSLMPASSLCLNNPCCGRKVFCDSWCLCFRRWASR